MYPGIDESFQGNRLLSPSFWFDLNGPASSEPDLQGDVRADVCVIGGGVSGLSAAYHLTRKSPGLSVITLEALTVGSGASGRNAGQLIVSFGGGDLGAQVRRYGAENIGLALDYINCGILGMEKAAEVENFDYDYAPSGYLKTALRVEGDSELERYKSLYDQLGHGAHFTYLNQSQVDSELHSPLLGGALFDPRGGQFNPLKFVRGLKDSVLRGGGQIYEMSPALTIDATGPRIVLKTARGTVTCEKLIVATNGFSHLLGGIDSLGLKRGQLPLIVRAAVTEPLLKEDWLIAGWPRRSGVNVLSQLFYSFAPTPDGRLLWVGGYNTYAPHPRAPLPEHYPELRQDHILRAFFPRLSHVLTARVWGGPISITADWAPHVGFARDKRITYAWGCWGHGMAIGFRNGRTLAELTLSPDAEAGQLWFVRRAKRRWPPILGAVVAQKVIQDRRRGNRKIAARIGLDLDG
ncbi:FAD-dependent oxidoreductase [Mesorhizobium sp. WSM4887]|uniref:NAD(P)/FAD-dependent oxidoreductase n=1 Tax=Mesorhizobium sp. WSM4887 TaxID=3038543 RepID=UPI002415CD10|nr:FAD-dependent oxidoreductase [Mesorhizobium sp. WSM4887]MDG4886840.1 FAD-dependent oxidoreductase [Mesorhizobium sp. WSM4887]